MDILDEYRNIYFKSPFYNGFTDFKGCLLPDAFKKIQDEIYNMEVREEDVWLISFPKAGTTWCQEMLWMILSDLSFEDGQKEPLRKRSPYLELSSMYDFELFERLHPDDAKNIKPSPFVLDSVGYVKKKISDEACVTIKTHLPWQLLPKQIQDGIKKPKIVYVARNPKDVCVSFFHHSQPYQGYSGDFETFCELFLADKLFYSPFWSHVIPFYQRNGSNVLFITYEEMIKDLPSILRKVSTFIGKSLNESQIEELASHLSFENMKKNPSVNNKSVGLWLKPYHGGGNDFMRSGKSGSFKENMSAEMISKFDKWMEENTQGTGFKF